MTTVQTMLRADDPRSGRGARTTRAPRHASLALLPLLAAGVFAFGCAGGRSEPALVPPQVIVAPYDASRGEVLWAVAPLGNESGVSSVDTDRIADALVAKIDEVRGVSCLPLNRTLAAMRARNIRSIRTPAEARLIAQALGADALVVGNITAYDPYDPPKLGLSIALYSRDRGPDASAFDPMRLRSSYSDYGQISRSNFADRPTAVVSEHLDGANHEVQMELRRYATGRHDPQSALGWRAGLMSMDLYTEFAANFAVSRLIEQERLRVGQPGMTATTTANPDSQTP